MGLCVDTCSARRTFLFLILLVVLVLAVLYTGSVLDAVNLDTRPLMQNVAVGNTLWRLVSTHFSSNWTLQLLDNSGSIYQNNTLGISSVLQPIKANTTLSTCGKIPLNLVGPIPVLPDPLPWDKLNNMFPDVEKGGRWRPKHCHSRHHMAIVIPYRDRDSHLRTFLRHMHPFWAKQELDYGVYVVEQIPGSTFNRGMLMNIGFVEALKVDNYSCVIFSDVDLLPENDNNIYGCPSQPRHMSVAIDKHHYTLMYKTLFGGVENFQMSQFKKINGFSNKFFGWGGEDDDLYRRIIFSGYKLTRPPADVARYKMLSHIKSKAGPYGSKLLASSRQRQPTDGLNSLQYKVTRHEEKPLYTLVSVSIDQDKVFDNFFGRTPHRPH